tara:strand:+ start:869 stop:2170 length:1302 start_codon:yes stop_codon:yes gene_type:complete
MKSFFKKIGKELKRGFRKIGKFMNSKIGKIMGGVLLAWNIGSIFASLYKGVAGAATQSAAVGIPGSAASQIATEAATGVSSVGIPGSAASQAATQAAKAAANPLANATIDSAGKILINNGSDLAKVAQGVTQTALAKGAVYSSIAESSAGLEAALQENLKVEATKKTTKAVVSETAAAVGDAGVPVLDAAVPKVNVAFDNPDQLTEVFSGTFDDAANAKLDLLKPITKLPTETIEGQALSSTQMNQQIAWANSTPAARTEFLANKANRALYETNFQNLTSTFKAPVEYGSTEFSSLGNAFKGGKNLLESTANVGKQIMDTSIGEVTGGRVGGFLGRRSAAGTAYTGVTTAASLLAEPPEEPITPNYQARSIAQQLGQSSEAIAMQPLSQGPADMYTQMDWSSPDYFKQLMSINNNAGMSYAYGGGGMNAGRYG